MIQRNKIGIKLNILSKLSISDLEGLNKKYKVGIIGISHDNIDHVM